MRRGKKMGSLPSMTGAAPQRKPPRTEENVLQSERVFRLLVEGVRDYAIFMLDPQGNVASWNPGAERIKGYKAEEIIGKHFSNFYPAVDREAGKPEYELKVAKATGRFRSEERRVGKEWRG